MHWGKLEENRSDGFASSLRRGDCGTSGEAADASESPVEAQKNHRQAHGARACAGRVEPLAMRL